MMGNHSKSTLVITINAVWYIALGIAATIYAPLLVAFFGIADLPEGNILLYWHMVAFARLFGGAILGAGLIIWALRPALKNQALSMESMRGILSALLMANLVLLFIAVTQQSAVWLIPAGWAIALPFLLLTLAYAFLLLSRPKKEKTTELPNRQNDH